MIPGQQREEGEGAAAAAAPAAVPGAHPSMGGAEMINYEELLLQLPGLQRQLRAAAQERAGLPPQGEEPTGEVIERDYDRVPRKPEPVLDEWDLRAKMEKRRRQEREMEGEH